MNYSLCYLCNLDYVVFGVLGVPLYREHTYFEDGDSNSSLTPSNSRTGRQRSNRIILINSTIIEHITYNILDDRYGKGVFTDTTIRGKLGVNAVKANRSIYDHVVYDSENEREFVSDLDIRDEVAVYVKLPDGFFIPTPIGKYNPDWAIAFYEGSVKHIYFVAETKGSMETLMFEDHTSTPEKAKIHCARQHFKAISNGEVVYDVVLHREYALRHIHPGGGHPRQHVRHHGPSFPWPHPVRFA